MDISLETPTSYQALQTLIEKIFEDIVRSLGVTEWKGSFSYFIQPPSPKLPPSESGFDACLNCFAFAKQLNKKPNESAEPVLQELQKRNLPYFSKTHRAGGYLYYSLQPHVLATAALGEYLVPKPATASTGNPVVIEFSSPNTNKPLHLGHVRNNCLGTAVSLLMSYQGHPVTKINLINDRGIHICKSMLAYQKLGKGVKRQEKLYPKLLGTTPASEGQKGDHFVGHYYVQFENLFLQEYKAWCETEQAQQEFEKWKTSNGGKTVLSKNQKEREKIKAAAEKEKDETKKAALLQTQPDDVKTWKDEQKNFYLNHFSALGKEANEMLIQWEAGDEKVRALWKEMNGWVFDGFSQTYKTYGVSFDEFNWESQVYEYGRELVLSEFEKGKLEKLENGSIACDLIDIGVLKKNSGEERKKVLLRANGTTVYMTQDLGIGMSRWRAKNFEKMIYVVGNEQERHFQVLFKLLEAIEPELKDKTHHLSYGMVLLPTGRMKSREGTAVDADDLLEGIRERAKVLTKEKWPELTDEQVSDRAEKIALAAIKFYILSFTPQSTVKFDPEASLSFSGKAGPYMLYQYARTRSILTKAGLTQGDISFSQSCFATLGTPEEIDLLRKLYFLPRDLEFAAKTVDPSKVCDAVYELTRLFNLFYRLKDKHQVINCPEPELRKARLQLVVAAGNAFKRALNLLGIETLEQM